MHSWIMAGLLLCGSVLAGHSGSLSTDWNELREKGLHMGLSAEQVDRMLMACRENKRTIAETEDFLCPVYFAHAEELPVDCVFLKIEEGLAKRVAWQDIHVAADKRLECMRKADGLVMSVRENRGGQHRHLVMHTCMALESGLPEEVLKNVFNRPARFRYGRMIHVVEAGESLQLAGLEPEQTQHIMNDCLDRDLTGEEVMRVVDIFQNGLREGKNYDALHATLWVASDTASSGR